MKTEWISVKDRLPGTSLGWSKPVLVYTITGKIEISEFNRGKHEMMDSWLGLGSSEVTHWMPLPSPPNETKQQEK
jgi:hypothetical protein